MDKIQSFTMLVCLLLVANAWGANFLDDFNRPDGDVGNGWTTQTDGTITVQIVNNEVLIAGTQATDWARCGISRTVEGATMVSCDFLGGDNFNFHIRINGADTGAFLEIYTWGGPLIHANSVDGSWPGWTDITGSSVIAGEYNNVMLEQNGTDFNVILNGTTVATLTNAGITSIASMQIASDAAAGTTGSLHIDNVRLEGEEPAPEPEPEPFDMEIPYAMTPPVIDGEVDPVWEGVSKAYFVPLEDPNDGSGSWQVLWDSENLYVIVDITDDVLNNDSASAWQDDSVEVYFDGGNTKLSTPLSGDDHQYTFGWTADDIQGTNITGYTDGFEQAQVTTDTGWRIEIKMPWLSLQGVAPQAGDLIGIDCYYNDDDDGGDSREGKMLTFSPIEGWNDASQWGTAILLAPASVDPGTEGLAAYYAFENDANDSSGNGNDGTIVGNPTWIDGVQGTALEFHGLGSAVGGGDYIDCGSDASLDITGPISLAMWIRPDANDPEGQGMETAPMAKALSGMSPSWSYQVRYGWGSPQPYMAFTFNTSPRAWVYVGQNLIQGEWCHIACSHDGTTLKCYLDGVETDSTPMGQITSSPAPLLVGSDGWGSDWIGGIDEVTIYNRGLSESEILYLAGK